MAKRDLLYVIPKEERNPVGVRSVLAEHPEIKFVSMISVDLGGNDTDERIPAYFFCDSAEEILDGGIQTDGSSVILPGIAILNNARVDMLADLDAKWTVDYNYEHTDQATGQPVGTLRIPCYLAHEGQRVDSRALLRRSEEVVRTSVLELIGSRPDVCAQMGFAPGDVVDVVVTIGTELEFWVKTPGEQADTEQLSVSQVLQEQYWKRTKGPVRTALEESLILLEKYGLKPEMGHKEVGGVKARVEGAGQLGHIMEQMEIDWRYSHALEAADNELLARIVVKETFRRHGLDLLFMAKPIEGVAGNGEHTHFGMALKIRDGRTLNLFAPPDMHKDYLGVFGWGALMGILKNYESIGTLVTCTNDAFNRLKPGFEAPVAIVASIGHRVELPSRNRSVLVGLIRDMKNLLATRFEIRSPNPHTNTYLAVAAFAQAAIDGMTYAARSGKSSAALEAEFRKRPGEAADYLETDRKYHSEEDVFEHYNEAERFELFGKPAATVWEGLHNLEAHPDKTAVLLRNDVFTPALLNSFRLGMLKMWTTELYYRIIPESADLVRMCTKCHDDGEGTDLDVHNWAVIQQLRRELLQSATDKTSLFARVRASIRDGRLEEASRLQIEMSAKVAELRQRYADYRRNLLDVRMPDNGGNGNRR